MQNVKFVQQSIEELRRQEILVWQFSLLERLILLFTCSIWENQLYPNPAVEEAVNTVSWVHQISGLPAVTES